MGTSNEVKDNKIELLMGLKDLSIVLLKLFSIIVFLLLLIKSIFSIKMNNIV